MSHILIGICTRQRNALLRRLLGSIWRQTSPAHHSVQVLIVDNNDDPCVNAVLFGLSDKFKLTVVHEEKPGLVNARNRVLDFATESGADWLIGVDDDEWVADDWLEQFIVAIETLDTSIIVAAKNIIYPEYLSPYVEHLQEEQKPAGEPTRVFSTANFALKKNVFHTDQGLGLRFSTEFNESGAEDFEFMMRAKHGYGLIALKWPHAIVYEEFDGKRSTFRYHFRRKLFDQVARYRTSALLRKAGMRGTLISNAGRILLAINRFVVFGCIWLIAGLALTTIGHSSGKRLLGRSVFRLARVIAIVPYLFGISTAFYGKTVDANRSTARSNL